MAVSGGGSPDPPPKFGTHSYRQQRESLAAHVRQKGEVVAEARKKFEQLKESAERLEQEQAKLDAKASQRLTADESRHLDQLRRDMTNRRQSASAARNAAAKELQNLEKELEQRKSRLRALVAEHEQGPAVGRLGERLTRIVQLGLTVGAALAASLVTALQRGVLREYGLDSQIYLIGIWCAGASITVGILYFLPDLVVDFRDSSAYRKGVDALDSLAYRKADSIRRIHWTALTIQWVLVLAALAVQVWSILGIA